MDSVRGLSGIGDEKVFRDDTNDEAQNLGDEYSVLDSNIQKK